MTPPQKKDGKRDRYRRRATPDDGNREHERAETGTGERICGRRRSLDLDRDRDVQQLGPRRIRPIAQVVDHKKDDLVLSGREIALHGRDSSMKNLGGESPEPEIGIEVRLPDEQEHVESLRPILAGRLISKDIALA